MGEGIFARLKKLAQKNGEVIITDEKNDDAYVIMSLDRYEMLTNDFGSEMDDDSYNDYDSMEEFDESFKEDNPEEDSALDDRELMKKVNDDIAKWRQGQNQKELDEKKENFKEDKKDKEIKKEVLTEEEKYYLEPLE